MFLMYSLRRRGIQTFFRNLLRSGSGFHILRGPNMNIFSILTLIGGLALFLYGMKAMGDGLTMLSGGRMEQLLEKLTSTRFSGVLLGLAVTAVIQSSSATTVMVVGFVNSGIMKLEQAVGVIMGANIGTTVTSWLLSLTGVSGNAVWIKLLKPSSFSPVLALIGICFLMFSKKEKKHNIGMILMGFAILMFGMETMSDAVAPLADDSRFTSILLMFSNPVLGTLMGLAVTAIIQSSSASVGILQALALTGVVPFKTAIPIIMGQNIGTCVTALISSIGTRKNARRAAMIHLYFNLIGTVLFMLAFYTLNHFVHFAFMGEMATPAGIAVIHSLFNIITTIVLFPFGNQLMKLAILTVPDKHSKSDVAEDAAAVLRRLDVHLLDRPAMALEQARYVTNRMSELSREAVTDALSMIDSGFDEDLDVKIRELENTIDTLEDKIGSYLIQIPGHDMSQKDSRLYSLIQHNIGNFERISDHAVGISDTFREMDEKKLHFSSEACSELKVMRQAVTDILDMSTDSFCTLNTEKAEYVLPLEEVIDALNLEEKQRHIERLRKGRCTIELGFILSDLTTYMERISDHCSNIAVCTLSLKEDEIGVHEYQDIIKTRNSDAYKKGLREMEVRYLLPKAEA